jgi:hypothetical protein
MGEDILQGHPVQPPKPCPKALDYPLARTGGYIVDFELQKQLLEASSFPPPELRPCPGNESVCGVGNAGSTGGMGRASDASQQGCSAVATALTQPRRRPILMKAKGSHSYCTTKRITVKADGLGKYVLSHSEMLQDQGWMVLVWKVQGHGDIKVQPSICNLHPAGHLLRWIGKCGVPARMTTKPWTRKLRGQ